jgi:cytoskeletal protein CcmA (bactofilin family)
VTIGASGNVNAEISAKSIHVAGHAKGVVRAEERVEVTSTGNLTGDLRSPRVALADGAKFKGTIDMDPNAPASGASASRSAGESPVPFDNTPIHASAGER